MLNISATNEWKEAHRGAQIGLLEISGVNNSQPSSELNDRKRGIEEGLVKQYAEFSRAEFNALPVMGAYREYYKRFKKTYHVLLQVESIAQKGKSLPQISPLVDANFMAEMETFVLTAGHDVSMLQPPVVIDASVNGDRITQMNGVEKNILAGDMAMRDAGGVSCTILYGQDNRSPIIPQTDHALYVAYAPPGISPESVEAQLDRIIEHIRLFSPDVEILQKVLLAA